MRYLPIAVRPDGLYLDMNRLGAVGAPGAPPAPVTDFDGGPVDPITGPGLNQGVFEHPPPAWQNWDVAAADESMVATYVPSEGGIIVDAHPVPDLRSGRQVDNDLALIATVARAVLLREGDHGVPDDLREALTAALGAIDSHTTLSEEELDDIFRSGDNPPEELATAPKESADGE
jgi:hypothetical protein